MATFAINGFAKGMDTRRPSWSAPADTLQNAKDVVLTSLGDLEVRKAFVEKYIVPGTFGLKSVDDEVTVFGITTAPSTLPIGVDYCKLTPVDATNISEVLSVDLFSGQVFASALMADASVRHFWDDDDDDVAEEVTSWFVGFDATQKPRFVRTLDNKVYAPVDGILTFCAIDDPSQWVTTEDGAGFSLLSNAQSGSETLRACEPFLEQLAIFAKKSLQLWHVESNDTNNERLQTLLNVGIAAARAVAPFRETDLLWLDTYRGVLALTPAGTDNQFAKIEDIGLPIQKHILAYMATLSATVIAQGLAFVEPGVSRWWLVIGERVYVFSSHPSTGVEGWTFFEPGFQITDCAVAMGRLYVRSGNTIYLYGGDDDDEYPPAGIGTIRLPSLRVGAPEAVKTYKGLDIGAEGTWTAKLYASEADTVGRNVATTVDDTFADHDIGLNEMSTNPILELTRTATGYGRVSQILVHYTPRHSG